VGFSKGIYISQAHKIGENPLKPVTFFVDKKTDKTVEGGHLVFTDFATTELKDTKKYGKRTI